MTTSIDWDRIIELDADRPAKPVSKLAGTRDYGRVVHQIRTGVALCAVLLATAVAMLALVVDRLNTPGALVPSGPTGVQMVVTGDPAVEAWAHVTYADGTERDYAPGSYRGDGIVAVVFTVAADADTPQTGCKIIVDNARVSEEVATAGQSATCRWTAP